jgi:hypothetical protein
MQKNYPAILTGISRMCLTKLIAVLKAYYPLLQNNPVKFKKGDHSSLTSLFNELFVNLVQSIKSISSSIHHNNYGTKTHLPFYDSKENGSKIKFANILNNRKIFLLFIGVCFLQFSINAQSIGIPVVAGAPVCAGSNVTITFSVTNGGSADHFTNATTYTVYLSDNSGSNFTSIATFNTTGISYDVTDAGITSGISQTITIPAGTPSGTGYEISLGSTSPTFDGSAGVNASINFTITASPTTPGAIN